MRGWQVDVEVLLLRLLADGELGHRWVREPTDPARSPDERAVALAGCEQGLCHSTSWRTDGAGLLVLTYAALPDPLPSAPADPLAGPLVVSGGDSLHPAPSSLARANVAAHAVRHLADLAERDPVVRAVAKQDQPLWSAVVRTARRTQHERARAERPGARTPRVSA